MCRPWSPAPVSEVAINSRPARRFTRVDLPTPLEPSSTAVAPGSMRPLQPLAAGARESADDVNRHTGRDRFDLLDKRPRIIDPVGLGQHDLGRSAALPDRDEAPLDPLEVDLRAERGDEERQVDVRDQRLRTRRAAGAPRSRAVRRGSTDRTAPSAKPTQSPTATSIAAKPDPAGGRARTTPAAV